MKIHREQIEFAIDECVTKMLAQAKQDPINNTSIFTHVHGSIMALHVAGLIDTNRADLLFKTLEIAIDSVIPKEVSLSPSGGGGGNATPTFERPV